MREMFRNDFPISKFKIMWVNTEFFRAVKTLRSGEEIMNYVCDVAKSKEKKL